MYNKKTSASKTEHCGTPSVTGTFDELSSSSTTVWDRQIRKELIRFRILSLTP